MICMLCGLSQQQLVGNTCKTLLLHIQTPILLLYCIQTSYEFEEAAETFTIFNLFKSSESSS